MAEGFTRIAHKLYLDSEAGIVWRTSKWPIVEFTRARQEFEEIKAIYGIPYADFEVIPVADSTDPEKAIARCQLVAGVSLEPILNPDWRELPFLDAGARDYLKVLTPLVENHTRIVQALDYYWSAIIDYQLVRTLAGKDFLYDLQPVQQTIFTNDCLTIVDTDPRFVLSDYEHEPRDWILANFLYLIPPQLEQLKYMFPETNALSFPNTNAKLDEVKEKLELDVLNPFQVFL